MSGIPHRLSVRHDAHVVAIHKRRHERADLPKDVVVVVGRGERSVKVKASRVVSARMRERVSEWKVTAVECVSGCTREWKQTAVECVSGCTREWGETAVESVS
jgi:hypothetical protein